jgi:hypothetical protein
MVKPLNLFAKGAFKGLRRAIARRGSWSTLRQDWLGIWQASSGHQLRRVAILCGVTVLTLCLVGTLLLDVNSPDDIPLFQAFLYTFITLFGATAMSIPP